MLRNQHGPRKAFIPTAIIIISQKGEISSLHIQTSLQSSNHFRTIFLTLNASKHQNFRRILDPNSHLFWWLAALAASWQCWTARQVQCHVYTNRLIILMKGVIILVFGSTACWVFKLYALCRFFFPPNLVFFFSLFVSEVFPFTYLKPYFSYSVTVLEEFFVFILLDFLSWAFQILQLKVSL